MSQSNFIFCPRCGTHSYEQLQTHGHCIECLYSSDLAVRNGKRDFLTLQEVERLIDSEIIHDIQSHQKKVLQIAS